MTIASVLQMVKAGAAMQDPASQAMAAAAQAAKPPGGIPLPKPINAEEPKGGEDSSQTIADKDKEIQDLQAKLNKEQIAREKATAANDLAKQEQQARNNLQAEKDKLQQQKILASADQIRQKAHYEAEAAKHNAALEKDKAMQEVDISRKEADAMKNIAQTNAQNYVKTIQDAKKQTDDYFNKQKAQYSGFSPALNHQLQNAIAAAKRIIPNPGQTPSIKSASIILTPPTPKEEYTTIKQANTPAQVDINKPQMPETTTTGVKAPDPLPNNVALNNTLPQVSSEPTQIQKNKEMSEAANIARRNMAAVNRYGVDAGTDASTQLMAMGNMQAQRDALRKELENRDGKLSNEEMATKTQKYKDLQTAYDLQGSRLNQRTNYLNSQNTNAARYENTLYNLNKGVQRNGMTQYDRVRNQNFDDPQRGFFGKVGDGLTGIGTAVDSYNNYKFVDNAANAAGLSFDSNGVAQGNLTNQAAYNNFMSQNGVNTNRNVARNKAIWDGANAVLSTGSLLVPGAGLAFRGANALSRGAMLTRGAGMASRGTGLANRVRAMGQGWQNASNTINNTWRNNALYNGLRRGSNTYLGATGIDFGTELATGWSPMRAMTPNNPISQTMPNALTYSGYTTSEGMPVGYMQPKQANIQVKNNIFADPLSTNNTAHMLQNGYRGLMGQGPRGVTNPYGQTMFGKALSFASPFTSILTGGAVQLVRQTPLAYNTQQKFNPMLLTGLSGGMLNTINDPRFGVHSNVSGIQQAIAAQRSQLAGAPAQTYNPIQTI